MESQREGMQWLETVQHFYHLYTIKSYIIQEYGHNTLSLAKYWLVFIVIRYNIMLGSMICMESH